MDDKIIFAKDITDCSECPLYDNDCCGGWKSGAGGVPIEPPCALWDGDEEISAYMYSSRYDDYEPKYSSWSKDSKQEEKERRQNRIEELERQIRKHSKYDNAQVKYEHDTYPRWYCPRCHNWISDDRAFSIDDIKMLTCPICYTDLAHSWELESLLGEENNK